jgi:hypothetical protein
MPTSLQRTELDQLRAGVRATFSDADAIPSQVEKDAIRQRIDALAQVIIDIMMTKQNPANPAEFIPSVDQVSELIRARMELAFYLSGTTAAFTNLENLIDTLIVPLQKDLQTQKELTSKENFFYDLLRKYRVPQEVFEIPDVNQRYKKLLSHFMGIAFTRQWRQVNSLKPVLPKIGEETESMQQTTESGDRSTQNLKFTQILDAINNNLGSQTEEAVARRHESALKDDVIPWLDTMSEKTDEFIALGDVDAINTFFSPSRSTRWFDAGWFGAVMDYLDSEIDPIASLNLETLQWTKPEDLEAGTPPKTFGEMTFQAFQQMLLRARDATDPAQLPPDKPVLDPLGSPILDFLGNPIVIAQPFGTARTKGFDQHGNPIHLSQFNIIDEGDIDWPANMEFMNVPGTHESRSVKLKRIVGAVFPVFHTASDDIEQSTLRRQNIVREILPSKLKVDVSTALASANAPSNPLNPSNIEAKLFQPKLEKEIDNTGYKYANVAEFFAEMIAELTLEADWEDARGTKDYGKPQGLTVMQMLLNPALVVKKYVTAKENGTLSEEFKDSKVGKVNEALAMFQSMFIPFFDYFIVLDHGQPRTLKDALARAANWKEAKELWNQLPPDATFLWMSHIQHQMTIVKAVMKGLDFLTLGQFDLKSHLFNRVNSELATTIIDIIRKLDTYLVQSHSTPNSKTASPIFTHVFENELASILGEVRADVSFNNKLNKELDAHRPSLTPAEKASKRDDRQKEEANRRANLRVQELGAQSGQFVRIRVKSATLMDDGKPMVKEQYFRIDQFFQLTALDLMHWIPEDQREVGVRDKSLWGRGASVFQNIQHRVQRKSRIEEVGYETKEEGGIRTIELTVMPEKMKVKDHNTGEEKVIEEIVDPKILVLRHVITQVFRAAAWTGDTIQKLSERDIILLGIMLSDEIRQLYANKFYDGIFSFSFTKNFVSIWESIYGEESGKDFKKEIPNILGQSIFTRAQFEKLLILMGKRVTVEELFENAKELTHIFENHK